MRKTLLIAALLVSFASYSQKHGFVSSYNGLAIPLSSYKWDGNAKLGMSYAIDGGYFFSKSIGVGAKIAYLRNNIDTYGVNYDYKKALSSLISGMKTESYGDNWTMLNIGAGLYSNINFTSKFYMQTKLLIGLLMIKSPYINFFAYDNVSYMDVEVFSDNQTVIDFNSEIAFKYDLSENFSLGVFGNILYAKPTFSNSIRIETEDDSAKDVVYNQQAIGIVNTGLSFTYKF